MPAQQESWIATAYLESGTIARGQVGCLNAAGTAYVVASAANRTATGRRSACIALSNGDADNPSGAGFEAQYVGVVPPSISGLGTGTASSIRVSSAGILERATFDSADDVCGRCDTDGTAYVCFPLIGLAVAFGAALPTPNYGIIYRGTDGLPKTATHASIDATGGYIEHAADRAGGAATTGDVRGAKDYSLKVRAATSAKNVVVIKHQGSGSGGSARERLAIGADIFGDSTEDADEVYIIPQRAIIAYLRDTADGGGRQGWQLERAADGHGIITILRRTNLAFLGGSAFTPTDLGSGHGIQYWGVPVTEPSGNPANGCLIWPDPTTKHPIARMPNGDVFDLTSGSGKCLLTFTGSAVANTTTFLNAYGIPQATEAGFTIRSICVTADAVASAGTYSVQVTVNGTAISPALAFVVTTGTSSGQAALATPYAINAGDAIGVKVVGSSNSEAPNLGFNVTVCVGS